jgi:SecD/SecF fusion protein
LLVYVGTTELKRKRLLGTILTCSLPCLPFTRSNKSASKRASTCKAVASSSSNCNPPPTPTATSRRSSPTDIQQAIGILEKRLNPDGSKDLLIAPQGEKRILIQMPGVS